jgi:glycerol-3-phosphate dehydrogenase subunit B
MTEVLIIGAGLTGLFASILAANRGASVTLAAQGRGGLELSHGCIDIWGRTTPSRALVRLRNNHPYHLADVKSLYAALDIMLDVTREAEYPLSGNLKRNFQLPTATGTVHPTSYAPLPLSQGDLGIETSITLAKLNYFRDFHPHMAATNMRRAGISIKGVIELPILNTPIRRDAYATDIARFFDDAIWRKETARLWKPRLAGIHRLGLPAVLGLHHPMKVLIDMQEQLGVSLFEIPTLPPSIPGLRLERILRQKALHLGIFFIEGSQAVGHIVKKSKSRRVSGVTLQTAGGPRLHKADVVILATGGVLNGGLISRQDGRFQESVFDLPVSYNENRAVWTTLSPFDSQPYATYGLPVNDRMQPLNANGVAIYENLFAAGGLLAGAERAMERSRQGIDLATAYRAIEVALG